MRKILVKKRVYQVFKAPPRNTWIMITMPPEEVQNVFDAFNKLGYTMKGGIYNKSKVVALGLYCYDKEEDKRLYYADNLEGLENCYTIPHNVFLSNPNAKFTFKQ